MAPKSKGRSWVDVQIAIITISMSVVLVLWNLFASTDRVKAERKAAEALAEPPEPVETPIVEYVEVSVSPTLAPGEKLMLGGEAPQTVVTIEKVVRRNNGGGGGGGSGGGGGGGGTTSTSSS